MKQKPKTPYQRLMEDARAYAFKVKYRHLKDMWWYPKADLAGSFRLDVLYQRVIAADELGYDVIMVAKDDGLHVKYIKKVPETPCAWRL